MKNIQLILIIAILIVIYLISMQWLGKVSTQEPILPMPQEVRKVLSPPVVVEAPVNTPAVIQEVKQVTPTIETAAPDEKIPKTEMVGKKEEEEIKNPELTEYRNINYGYHLSFPKKMYYAGFGPRNGALHSLAIQADTLPETFGYATVRVLYYGKKILPELQNTHNNSYKDPEGKFILLLLNGEYSVKIESDTLQSPTVKAIESTIGVD